MFMVPSQSYNKLAIDYNCDVKQNKINLTVTYSCPYKISKIMKHSKFANIS